MKNPPSRLHEVSAWLTGFVKGFSPLYSLWFTLGCSGNRATIGEILPHKIWDQPFPDRSQRSRLCFHIGGQQPRDISQLESRQQRPMTTVNLSKRRGETIDLLCVVNSSNSNVNENTIETMAITTTKAVEL